MNINDADDASHLPELDAEWVVRDMGNDEEAYRAVADMFLEDLAVMRDALNRSTGDSATKLLPAIHEAANSLGVIGARRGAAVVRGTERRIRQGEGMTLDSAKTVVQHELDRAEAALRAWLLGAGPVGQAPLT